MSHNSVLHISMIDTALIDDAKYGELKKILVDDIDAFVAPMREKRESITDEDVANILARGAKQAQERAHAKMIDVKKKIGVTL